MAAFFVGSSAVCQTIVQAIRAQQNDPGTVYSVPSKLFRSQLKQIGLSASKRFRIPASEVQGETSREGIRVACTSVRQPRECSDGCGPALRASNARPEKRCSRQGAMAQLGRTGNDNKIQHGGHFAIASRRPGS